MVPPAPACRAARTCMNATTITGSLGNVTRQQVTTVSYRTYEYVLYRAPNDLAAAVRFISTTERYASPILSLALYGLASTRPHRTDNHGQRSTSEHLHVS